MFRKSRSGFWENKSLYQGNPLDVVVVEIAGRSGISEGASAHFSAIFLRPFGSLAEQHPNDQEPRNGFPCRE